MATIAVAFLDAAACKARHASEPVPLSPLRFGGLKPAGPPCCMAGADARFTVVGYADLECPLPRVLRAVLKRWIDRQPGSSSGGITSRRPCTSPGIRLPTHAWRSASGETGGHATFWQAVAWFYSNTRGDGQGPPEGLRYPDLTPAMQGCLDSERPDAVIRAQAAEAAQQGIAATPALQLRDRESGKTLLLHGPVEGDALLSAIDLLAAGKHDRSRTRPFPRHARRRCR